MTSIIVTYMLFKVMITTVFGFLFTMPSVIQRLLRQVSRIFR